MAGIAGLVSAGVSIAGALGGSDTASGVQLPPQFTMPNMGAAAGNAFSGIQNLPGQSLPPQLLQMYQQYASQLQNNPYAPQFQTGANQASQMGQTGATGAYNTGQTFQGAGTSLIPYASNIMQTAFDPQNALYAKTQHDLIDQTRAGQAARGVATTPYGAAGESDALRKFDIDWQNQQLSRQVAGGQAGASVIGSGFNTAAGGAALSDTGVNNYLGASAMPYSTFNTIGQGQLGATGALGAGAGQAQQLGLNPVQAYLQYLGLGNQAGGVANQNAQVGLNQANLGFNQNQTLGANLGAGIQGIGKAAGSSFPGASSGWNWLTSTG